MKNSGRLQVKAVIFDLFGTLIASVRRTDFETMLAEMAGVLAVPSYEFIHLWLPTLEADIEEICKMLSGQPDAALLSRAAGIRRTYTGRILAKPREDALQTLKELKELRYRIGLISNCAADVPPVWPSSPLAPLVEVPIFSCSVHLKKPDSRVYLLASEQLVTPPQNCLYVADGSERELTGASEVGMHSILFRGPDQDPYDEGLDRKEWQGPTAFSLKDVLRLLDNAG